MINSKYYADMQAFPQQFSYKYSTTLPTNFPQKPRIIVCGMWWSALYVPFMQDLFNHYQTDIRLDASSSYTLPPHQKEHTVIVCASHSGNTEETISCFHEAIKTWTPLVVFASGGTLLELAKTHHIPYYQLPTGLQPRLSTGYFIVALLDLLSQVGYFVQHIQTALQEVNSQIDIAETQLLTKQLLGKTPIIYTMDVLKSISLICKIKLNENSKTPAFAHYIPELNHNEMCGWMWKTMHPYFLIFSSQFTHPRNLRRSKIMYELLEKEWYPVHIITPQGKTIEQEAIWIYQFMDFVTYFLAEAKGIDPEPVKMVEDFKLLLWK